MKQKYYANLSFLRAVACAAIVILHTVNSAAILYRVNISKSAYGISMAVVESLSWAVPCFLMVTGALLLDPKRELPLKKLFSRYILRVFLALAVFVLLFRALDMLLNGEVFRPAVVWQGLRNILTGESWAHLWYLYVLIGLYLLLPLFRAAAEKLSVKVLWYLCGVVFLFLSLMPLLGMLDLESGFSIPVASVYPLYLFLGYLLFQKPVPRLISVLMVLIGAGGLACAGYFRYALGFGSLSPLLNYASPLTVLLSAGIFSLFARIDPESGEKNTFTKSLLGLDRASFGIYLLHLVFVRLILRYWNVNPYALGVWSFAIISIAVYLVSYVLVYFLCMIPGVPFVLGASSRPSPESGSAKGKGTDAAIKLSILLIASGVVAAVVYGFLSHPERFAFLPDPVSSVPEQTVSSEVPPDETSEPESSGDFASEISQESVPEESSVISVPEETSSQESSGEESSAWETPAYQGVDKDEVREKNPQAAAVLDEVGWDLQNAFNWVASFRWAYMTVDYSMGAEWFRDFGYEYHYGNCYVMASTFCDLAKALGYDARQMIGEVPMEHGGFGRHSWVEIRIAGGTYVFDPDYTSETKRNGFLLTYEQGNTWVYMNIEPMP
ncbi:MAG: acyltransferase family protein [Clostridia bacterium]|nr:acyltransferase family protein [Clostridia bacterium]